MGLFDLASPLFGGIDHVLAMALPGVVRLILWGILAGWLTMVVYRRLSNQERIGELKKEQKKQQQVIANFDGEFDELMPLIMSTLKLGFKQLGLAIGPALLATIPVLFLIAWVSGQFGYQFPEPGENISVSAQPTSAIVTIAGSASGVQVGEDSTVTWPAEGEEVVIFEDTEVLMILPLEEAVPVIHKEQWWNMLFANPLGYLPDTVETELVEVGIPPSIYLPFGPSWMQGWMFLFFMVFLISSVAFKFILKID